MNTNEKKYNHTMLVKKGLLIFHQ